MLIFFFESGRGGGCDRIYSFMLDFLFESVGKEKYSFFPRRFCSCSLVEIGDHTNGDCQTQVAQTAEPAEPDEIERHGGLRLLAKGLAEGALSQRTADHGGHELERCQDNGHHSELPALHKPHNNVHDNAGKCRKKSNKVGF